MLEVPIDVAKLCSAVYDAGLHSGARIGVLNPRMLTVAQPSFAVRAAFGAMIDTLGVESQRAQRLGAAITTAGRLAAASDQELFVCFEGGPVHSSSRVLGFIKVGPKQLFMTVPASHPSGAGLRGRPQNAGAPVLAEITPLCVLDFFVYESVRRGGVGKALFDTACRLRGVPHPALLAYDRPSDMFKGFLRKHFGLTEFIPQSNNFVLFDVYWDVVEDARNNRVAAYWDGVRGGADPSGNTLLDRMRYLSVAGGRGEPVSAAVGSGQRGTEDIEDRHSMHAAHKRLEVSLGRTREGDLVSPSKLRDRPF